MSQDNLHRSALYERHQPYGPSWEQFLIEPLDNLKLSGRRAILALLGIAVGCMAVVALLNIGHNGRLQAMSIFKGMGSDLLVSSIQPAQGSSGGPQVTVSTLDITSLHQKLPEIASLSPLIPVSMDVRFQGHTLNTTIIGTNAELLQVLDLSLNKGRFISQFDTPNPYVVLGAKALAELSKTGTIAGLGDKIQIGSYLFEIIGVLDEKGSNPLIPVTPDEAIFIPSESMSRIVPNPQISTVVARHPDPHSLSEGAERLQQWLSEQISDSEISVQIPHQLIDGMAQQSRMFSWLLSGLGGIALLVGGIGIMNVMVMNISERRREIGVRMALGARPRDIARLFLSEAVVLATAGALIGAICGLAISWVFVYYSEWQHFAISPVSLPLGIGSAIATGLFFGLAPAISASRLSPLQALRDD
ncbi:ABC transporter permease [Pantoea agglomerans]|uniref:ABC transporter permease n=1 Tax=Enterobacter agglomerans TaxID=549 RepID=UPI0010C24594|nr:ABC transporter permease [Pantoea agglomerans]MBD8145418.1 ABC transporter permease [Pantoea agglomerans]MBD8184150.1 ABC transporter permease [Pantoea agglomerans]MBD8223139.1 ABC transporter permease [Pantoea agglomerans]TKJ54200.1 ABC transporter permease [Pantoea agglomerans]TKK14528.1 ABC transporter permease [Pantoea agglomerans]